ncbi:AAA family ATPase [Gallibacterium salpingitidis]|uniref:replicative DNA helicase n=1 Tax=Gallibacterium salpingitidis TaxID=505341 RepID=UPI002670640F|nr:DnaB-like helicase C-terminal domain-containing protein [Gallibacterium salpingitidis]WKT00507.1 AAA family ATPase [Gallibacterium salpingitidis]
MEALYNITAEKSVLGGLMMNPNLDRVERAISLLNNKSFYISAHQIIFREIRYLFNQRKPIDLVTLEARLDSVGVLKDVGGISYLAELTQFTPNAANVLGYAETVKEDAIKRFTLAKLQDCQAMLFEKNDLSATERLENITKLFSEVTDYAKSGNSDGLKNGKDILGEWLKYQEAMINNPELMVGVSSGFTALDDLLGPQRFIKGSLAVVGARPKCGKTTFLAHLAANCVTQDKKAVAIFSLEMPTVQIFNRLLGQNSKQNIADVFQSEQLSNDFIVNQIYTSANNLVRDDLLYIDDTPSITIEYIRRECRLLKQRIGDIGLIAVDYLTLMTAKKAERNDLAYGEITKELKKLAKELDCVVLLLTQLNRNLENRTDKKPKPGDSKDTGQIEQDCDYWIGLYKPSVYYEKADPTVTEVLLSLNRHGKTGKIYVDQKNGLMLECNQAEAANRAECHTQETKKTKRNIDF